MSLVIPISSILFNVGSLLENINERNIPYIKEYIQNVNEKEFILILGIIIFIYAIFSFFIRRYIIRQFAKYIVDVRFNLWLIWDHIRLTKVFFNIADWLDRYLVSCLLENLLQPKPVLVN